MKTKIFTLVMLAFIGLSNTYAQVKIGENATSVHESAILELESNTQGFLPPRMTSAHRDAIPSPPEGLIIYNTDNSSLELSNGSHWVNLTSLERVEITNSGTPTASGLVGIGTDNPNDNAVLDIVSTEKGLLPTRLTSTQRDAIPSPAAGLMIYNTTSKTLEYSDGTDWVDLKTGVKSTVNDDPAPSLSKGVGIGISTPDANAVLEVASTIQGFLPPRMTTSQRDDINNPAEGLVLYNTENKGIEFYNGDRWCFMAAFFDPDALAYIRRVEGATGDNQPLEEGVRLAINAFVVGCKADGIWDAIKASCILAGARTLNGALQPLVGTAPTNFNFVSADYNRVTGLKGDGATTYLDSNRNNNADPQNSNHNALYITEAAIGAGIGAGLVETGSNVLLLTNAAVRNRTSVSFAPTTTPPANNSFFGSSRAAAGSFVRRLNGVSDTHNFPSQTPLNANVFVFARNVSGVTTPTPARMTFYSIGEALDLALLEARVTTLMNDIGGAIP